MKRMLFNATHAEETRVGIVDGQKLIDIDIETAGREARKSNIYKGVVTRIEPSLEACFVNYGEERHGFLPFKEISRAYFKEGVDVRTATIREAITEGQELIVQVEKEERGNKGAALTTFVSLAGRYLVLMPNNPRAGGVSRRIEGEERQELREAMEKLELPRGMSTIARTAGIGRTTEELQWDLNYLLKLWEAISDAALPQYELVVEENGRRRSTATTEAVVNGKALKRLNPAPFLIVEESNLVVRAIRDYFQPDIGEILVDTDDIYEQARQFMEHVMPDMVGRVKRYREDIPLFTRFQIEQQIETAYSRTVPLPSGGAIVIDHTEALVAIDVNSARATRGADIEETAFRTNCEAADEVARQMRLRDLGGLIVIDFIDMADAKNQRAVEQRLKEAIHCDRARVQMAKISRFGLMELSRQRLRPSLSEGSHITCPRCNGVGVIRDTESCALQVLRILQEEAMKEGTGAVHAQIPVDVATFLLNEKRNDIMKLEARHRVPIVLIPNTFLETPHYHIERLRQDDERLESTVPSFNRVEEIETKADDPYAKKGQDEKPARPKQVPVIKNVLPREPAPVHVETPREERRAEKKTAGRPAQMTPVPEKKGLFARIAAFLFGSSDEKGAEEKPVEVTPKAEEKSTKAEGERRGRRSSRRGGERSRGRRTERTDRLERAEKGEKLEKAEKLEKQDVEGAKSSEKAEKNERSRRSRSRRRSSAVAAAPVAEEAVKLEATEVSEMVEAAEAVNVEAPKTAEDEALEAAEGERSRSRRRRGRRRPAAEGEAVDAQKTEGVEAEVRDVKAAPEAAPVVEAPKAEAAEVVESPEVVEATQAAEAAEAAEALEAADSAEAETEGRSRRRRPRRRRSRNAVEDAVKTGEKIEEAVAAADAAPAPVVPEAPHAPVAPIVASESELVQIETKKTPVTFAVESAIREEAAEAARAEANASAESVLVIEAPAAVEAPVEELEEVEPSQVVEAASEAETVEMVEPVKVEPVRTVDVAEGLAENLAAAGLVQVETRADRPVFTGYEAVVQPGRIVAKTSADADEGPLEQVHTRPELCRPVVYEAVRYPGRPYTASAVTEEGPLEQVHTKPLN